MQISDEEKAQVAGEAREAARKMGQEALSKRLEEIGMSEFEDALYRRFFDPVATEISQLQVILQVYTHAHTYKHTHTHTQRERERERERASETEKDIHIFSRVWRHGNRSENF
jgi:hypothetical protein